MLNCFIIYSNLETTWKASRDKICSMDEPNDVGAHSSSLGDSRRNMVWGAHFRKYTQTFVYFSLHAIKL